MDGLNPVNAEKDKIMSKKLLTLIDEINKCMAEMTPNEVAKVEGELWKVTPPIAEETVTEDRRIRIAVALKHVAYSTRKTNA